MLPDALAWHVVLCPGVALKFFWPWRGRLKFVPWRGTLNVAVCALVWQLVSGPGVARCFCAARFRQRADELRGR